MRRENQHSSQNTGRIRTSIGAIRKEAYRCGVEVRVVATKSRNHFYAQLGRGPKHEVAPLVAELFAEFSSMVQPQRKAWHSENYHAVILDAAATGIVAFAAEFNPDGVRELIANTKSFRRPPQ
jgi:hypothetical protein